ncbi:hypothetical protein [Stieleria varia]|uniref:Phage shock protein B n=1 Tax=Stieleria varia TaxID=2528005 RepID=A0A5C6AZC0_9BACT|nr:hypothetical protein [Stieleria varia]TWU04346.1 hypothetical protein Pla52n_23860 [Stieleria varia]
MIPALLSCVFVFYLYRTLNAPPTDSPDASLRDSTPAALESRIDSLQQRLDRLATSLTREDRS